MNIRETFLKATEYLIPFRMENLMEPLLPKDIQKDSVGNYFTIIGKSKSMFTCHLDSYTKKLTKVNHVFYDNNTKVKTDGTSPLGGDDKTGMCILLNMIEHKVPGTYYFFIGEEPAIKGGGVYGSKNALQKNPDFFSKFDRVISFDRKGYTSIISKQNPGVCCSKEFVEALSNEFAKQGLEYKNDPTGYYTDSAVFTFVVPEVTNLSCGGFDEHKDTEWVDLAFLEKLADAATKIDWESLPVVRDPKKYAPRPKVKVPKRLKGGGVKLYNYKGFMKKTGYELYKVLKDYFDYYHMGPVEGQKFIEGKNVTFVNQNSEIENDAKINIRIHGTQIWVNDKKVGSLDNFERKYNIGFDCKFYNHADSFIKDLRGYCTQYNTNKIPYSDVQVMLKRYGDFTTYQLIFNYDSENALFDEDDFMIDEVNKCLEI